MKPISRFYKATVLAAGLSMNVNAQESQQAPTPIAMQDAMFCIGGLKQSLAKIIDNKRVVTHLSQFLNGYCTVQTVSDESSMLVDIVLQKVDGSSLTVHGGLKGETNYWLFNNDRSGYGISLILPSFEQKPSTLLFVRPNSDTTVTKPLVEMMRSNQGYEVRMPGAPQDGEKNYKALQAMTNLLSPDVQEAAQFLNQVVQDSLRYHPAHPQNLVPIPKPRQEIPKPQSPFASPEISA